MFAGTKKQGLRCWGNGAELVGLLVDCSLFPDAGTFGAEADLSDPLSDLEDTDEFDPETPRKKFGFGGLPYFLICHLMY